MPSNEYVMVHLNGGTKETALDVHRALGGAFVPQPNTDVFLAPGDAAGGAEPPHAWVRGFRVDGPGRRIGAPHRLLGEITAEIVGPRDRVEHVVAALRAFADVGDPHTEVRGTEVRTVVHLRPA
ncbi:hypothetical protein ACFV4M_30555 [Kitasatospora indigofera]|uniref:hypothetical protein n=1 Tax=Kitasatospora indigofera TaxID=67307 RepID=UPI003659B2A9